MKELQTDFGFLSQHDEQLVRLGRLAERYFPEDPNTCLLKLRQLSELLAQLTATRVGVYQSAKGDHFLTDFVSVVRTDRKQDLSEFASLQP
jgi:hypothetical protein